jgi:2-polyprenyl-6-methoxyphenol hydroxylase-like FAD-dependent oxidoreductase
MATDRSPEVLIVGAGPVGLFGALTLARQGIGVQIVDTGVWATTHSYALALHPQTLQLLHEFGLMQDVLEGSYPVRTIAFYDGQDRRAQISVGDGKTCLAVLRQDVLETLLERSLHDHGVTVGWRHEVSSLEDYPDYVAATVERYEQESRGYVVAHNEWVIASTTNAQFPLVIGADGYKSRVRRATRIDFPEVGPAQYYAVFEFKSNFDLQNEMRVVFHDGTTSVLWPLPNGYVRWSFQMPNYTDPDVERMKEFYKESGLGHFPSKRPKDRRITQETNYPEVLDAAHLRVFVAERAPWFVGSVDDLTWRTVVRFEKRLAASFGQGRMWLAGDAAHLTGPVGVQSMNVGMHEVHDLAGHVTRILRNQVSPAEPLASYNSRWLMEWRTLQGLDGGLKVQADTDPWVKQQAPQLLACLPAHGIELGKLAGQLNLGL